MEHKYIDADAMIQKLQNDYEPIDILSPLTFNLRQIKETMDDMPAADVEPVICGEWVKLDARSGMEQYKCSLCNSAVYVPECMGDPLYYYCPVCGAKMDGGSEE